ncbi:MAG: hypothetical protein CMP69_05325 [Flavobacteriales bacterium]|nr:hypothetical protein [Flavobacteriales bacterium]|tara:strand:- start:1469 stop:1759 length:291 start_codon:yes stop_codon:yes gene_type:complete
MKKNNLNSINKIIKKIVSNPKLSIRLEELDAIEIWYNLIGDNLKKYILDSRVSEGVLYVKVKSATVKNELFYRKEMLIDKINSELKKQLIQDINIK